MKIHNVLSNNAYKFTQTKKYNSAPSFEGTRPTQDKDKRKIKQKNL